MSWQDILLNFWVFELPHSFKKYIFTYFVLFFFLSGDSHKCGVRFFSFSQMFYMKYPFEVKLEGRCWGWCVAGQNFQKKNRHLENVFNCLVANTFCWLSWKTIIFMVYDVCGIWNYKRGFKRRYRNEDSVNIKWQTFIILMVFTYLFVYNGSAFCFCLPHYIVPSLSGEKSSLALII